MTRLLSLSFLIAAGATLISSPAWAQAAQAATGPAPALVAYGEAVVKRAPDRAWVTIATETRDRQAAEARRKAADAMTSAQTALRGAGVPADAIRTTGFTLTPEINYDNGRGEVRGYLVRNQIEVRVDDLDRLGPIIDTVQAGSNTAISVIGPRFGLKDEQAPERDALREAVEAARARAEAMASAAGRTLGAVVRIEEHAQPSGPMPRPEVMMMRAAADTSQTPITPGEIEVHASVTVTFELR